MHYGNFFECGSGCKVVYEEMRKYLVIFEEAVSHIGPCNSSRLNFLIWEENLIFFFISVETKTSRASVRELVKYLRK